MEKIENWENVEARGTEDFKNLPIGAYECVIKEAGIHENEATGKKTFRVAIDIAKGEFKDYYQKRYDSNTNSDKKWDNNACRYLAYEGENVSYFKGFITVVENSNPGYKWDWDENKLVGKKVCGIFQYEEYEKQDGTKAVKVRLNRFRSLDKIGEIEVSDNVRLLDGGYMSIDDYNERNEGNSVAKKAQDLFGSDVVEISNDVLPF